MVGLSTERGVAVNDLVVLTQGSDRYDLAGGVVDIRKHDHAAPSDGDAPPTGLVPRSTAPRSVVAVR